VLNASDARQDPWPKGDGLVSDRGGQSLWVCGADCTPVLIADPGTGHAAACHAGWRGVAAGILITALDRLVEQGARREDLVIALGPAVSGPRYQVGDEVVQAIAAAIPGDVDLSERGAVSTDEQPGRHRLDIRAAARLQLQQAGIAGERISHCPLCTVSEPELFHSWRRDQVKAVQWSGIVAQAPT
jgi:YfiH family protein